METSRYSRFILRHSVAIASFALLLTFIGGFYSYKLYRNLRPDLQELLPTYARSVTDLNEIARRLKSVDNLAVLVFSNDTKASKRFVNDLAIRLEKGPREIIAGVEYTIKPALQFFKRNRSLYIDLPDLLKIRKYVNDRLDYEREIRNPLNIFAETNIPEPVLDFSAMRGKYEARTSSFDQFPDGYYATPDETKRAILVYVPGTSSEMKIVRSAKRFVENTIAELNPRSYAADMRIHYTGGIENILDEHKALVSDLDLSSIVVSVLVTIVMLLYFKSIRGTLAVILSVVTGSAVTFGITYFMIGYLNANSAFLGSIILGNGINFGIIFLARYLEERRAMRRAVVAGAIAIDRTAKATLTAALAAGLSYGSLVLTDFRGFRQFGVIGLIGMVLCWISAFTVLPSFLNLIDRGRPLARPRAVTKREPGRISTLLFRHPGVIWMVTIIITVLSIMTWPRFSPDILEADLTRLRSRYSLEKGSGYYARYIDEIFKRYLSPIAVLPKTKRDAAEIAKVLKTRKEKAVKTNPGSPYSMLASVQTLSDFIPRDQTRKLRVLADIRSVLPEKLLMQLSPSDRRLARELIGEKLSPISADELPKVVLDRFTEKNGAIGNLVLVEPPLGNEIRQRTRLIGFVKAIRDSTDSVAPRTPVAGALPVSADTLESIARDGPRATLFAFGAVVLLVAILFRTPRITGLVLFALMLGVTWLSGLILGFGIRINFLNFVALPITFGIGVDYGVNIFQRFRQNEAGGILRVVRETGGAVLLCSLTTTIGYGSLLIAQNQAFVSFGLLAILGELCCTTAAVVALPAYLIRKQRRLGTPAQAEPKPARDERRAG